MLQDFDFMPSVVSPDGTKRVLLSKDYSFRVFDGKREIGAFHLHELSSNISIVWSPDSDRFAISYSDGGAIGGYHANIYQLERGAIIELPKPPKVAFDDFKKRYYCEERGNNIWFLGWSTDSALAFFVVQVSPTGDCGSIEGKSAGYLVDLNGNIVAKYDEKSTDAMQASCDKSGRVSFLRPSAK
jgi:WD40 repeat protein